MSNKIKIINNTNGQCLIKSDELRIRHILNGRGATYGVAKEQLETLMYNGAFSNMVKNGMLFIDDMEAKKELGVEPEDADKPTIVLLTDSELERFWRIIPFNQFKLEVKTLKARQLEELARYAILHGESGSIEKAEYLTDKTGIQVLKGIELERQNKEE